jgi:hypothetical protein
MKYVAVCVLSALTMLTASASPAQLLPPVLAAVDVAATGVSDSWLMAMAGGVLIALQLRRRQKSLRSPRTLILSS